MLQACMKTDIHTYKRIKCVVRYTLVDPRALLLDARLNSPSYGFCYRGRYHTKNY